MFLGYTSLSSFSTLLSTVSHSPPHSHSPLQWLHVVVHLQAVCGMMLWVGIWQPLIRERVSWFYSFWDSFEIFFSIWGGGLTECPGRPLARIFFHNVWRTVPRIYYTIEVEHPSLTEKHEMIMTLYIPWLSHVMWNYMLSHRKQQAFTHNFNCHCNMVSSSPAFRNCELQTQPATLV